MTEHAARSILLPVIGEDGAQTFYNTEYKEAYHSKVGPIKEAEHKFVCPTNIKNILLNKGSVKILDLFFGLGYNSGIAIDYSYCISELPSLEITAIEKDKNIVNLIKELTVPSLYKKYQMLLSKLSIDSYIKHENISIKLYMDCVFNRIKSLPVRYFDVIFFDPFSHKSTPEFWSIDFLKSVLDLLAPGGTLTTYSGLKYLQNLAYESGFKVKKVEPLGRKKCSLAITAS